MSYHHFTSKDRNQLEGFLKIGLKKTEIAKQLNFNRSSIYREIKRAKAYSEAHHHPQKPIKYYHAGAGDKDAKVKRSDANQCHHRLICERDRSLAIAIERCLKKRWSPEQIAGCLRKGYISVGGTYKKIKIAVQTIYDWIYEFRKDLCTYLRINYNHHYRHTRGYYIRKRGRNALKQHRSIDSRPEHIKHRTRYGHWEGDTVVGAKVSGKETGSIATFVERKSKFLLAFKIDTPSRPLPRIMGASYYESTCFARGASAAFNEAIYAKYLKTLTLDNGKENALYGLIEGKTGLDVYFAHPYHSWERGTNENTNGLLRQYFPKKMSFKDITQEDIDKAVYELNNRPRKQLNWQTPNQVMRRIGALKG